MKYLTKSTNRFPNWMIEMKLLYCTKCRSIRSLEKEWLACTCGKSRGMYLTDGQNAEVTGPCLVLGIGNKSFDIALQKEGYDPEGKLNYLRAGYRFEAFIVPEGEGHNVRRIDA